MAQNFSLVKTLPEASQLQVQNAFVFALDRMRLLIIPFAGVGFFVSLLIEHHELRKRPSAIKKEEPKIDEDKNNIEVISEKPQAAQVEDDNTGSHAQNGELATDNVLVAKSRI